MEKYKAQDIAKWFVNRAIEETGNGGEYITNLKLQKLLYYAQGIHLALFGEPLFDDAIAKWNSGPVVPSVYHAYKDYKEKGIDKAQSVNIDAETKSELEDVYREFGQFSAYRLMQMTHNETPWQNAEHNGVIDKEAIKTYFEQHYIE